MWTECSIVGWKMSAGDRGAVDLGGRVSWEHRGDGAKGRLRPLSGSPRGRSVNSFLWAVRLLWVLNNRVAGGKQDFKLREGAECKRGDGKVTPPKLETIHCLLSGHIPPSRHVWFAHTMWSHIF